MRTNILIILLFSFYLSFSQTDNPIVDKIRNIKEEKVGVAELQPTLFLHDYSKFSS